ncbi:MAG: sulfatase [Myxococcota bacterium]|nr:sulfatase [Myxococcota bacterium]
MKPWPRSAERAGKALLAAALLASLACGSEPRPRELAAGLADLERPNLVLLLVDTLRDDWLEPYGFDAPTSPELARWAAEGVLFENVLAQSSWTKVSMASLLTSLWPRSHGVRLPTDGLGQGALSVAEILREAGYATYAVQSNGWLEQSFGFQQGFEHYVFPRAYGAAKRWGTASVWSHADRVVDEAVRLLDGDDGTRPFFLYLHFMDVHEYAAPPELRTFGTDQRGFYLAAIRWVDEALARVRKELDRRGLLDETVLVLASDHGEAFGENRSHGHAYHVFSPVLRVPLVLRLPFAIPARRVATQVRNLDIAPTLLDLAGVSVPESFEGESLLPLLLGEGERADRPNFASLPASIMKSSRLQSALNDGSWTLVRDLDAAGEEYLFDLAVDPREDANLVDLEPAEASRMREALDAHEAVGPRRGASESDVRIDPAIAERLRAVGYLQ